MRAKSLVPGIIFLIGGISTAYPCLATSVENESDAMQITTHFNDLTGIACDNTAQYCVAVGINLHPHTIDHLIYTTQNGGVTWRSGAVLPHPNVEDAIEDPTSSGQSFMTVRCSSTGKDCLVAGTTMINGHPTLLTYASHDAGFTWSAPSLIPIANQSEEQTLTDDYPFLRLKCNPTVTQCVLTTNTVLHNQHTPVIFSTQNGGETWANGVLLNQSSNTPNGIDILDLGCDQSGLICTALATAADSDDATSNEMTIPSSMIYSTHDGGLTWSDVKPMMMITGANQDAIPSQHDRLSLLTCDQSGLSCLALGRKSFIEHTGNTQTLIADTHAYLTKNGGLTWLDMTAITSDDKNYDNIFTSVHCNTNQRICAAVGVAVTVADEDDNAQSHPIIYTTTDGGKTWQKKPLTPPTGVMSLLLDVFCSDDTELCHAVGLLPKTA